VTPTIVRRRKRLHRDMEKGEAKMLAMAVGPLTASRRSPLRTDSKQGLPPEGAGQSSEVKLRWAVAEGAVPSQLLQLLL
jgi:hypothetical protein